MDKTNLQPNPQAETGTMALVKLLRGGLLTVPAEVCKQLKLKDGDYLDVELTERGILLKPVTVIDRQEAWRKIREAQASVRYIGPEPRPSPEEEERWIFETLAEEEKEHA
jgi:AbrB family looped-hinge helix DNA binding protein